jgi:DNA repair photolyase
MESTSTARTTMNGKPVLWRPAKTVLNLHSKFEEKLLCDGPTFSLGDACAYSCTYCYVPSMMRKAQYLPHDQPHESVVFRRQNALVTLMEQLTTPRRGGGRQPKYGEPSDQRVVYSSPLVDIAANGDLLLETAYACATILEQTHWHIRLLSKSHQLPKLAQVLIEAGRMRGFGGEDVRRRVIFGVSTGTVDDAQGQIIEPDCPKVSRRLQSLHQLQDEGFRTFGMLCPSLPQRDYAEFADACFESIRATRCEHVWAEVINPRGPAMERTVRALQDGGYEWQAAELRKCAKDPTLWEDHARQTFLAHVARMSGMNYDHPDNFKDTPAPAINATRLHFLQYVTKTTAAWWHAQRSNGAVCLGASAFPKP